MDPGGEVGSVLNELAGVIPGAATAMILYRDDMSFTPKSSEGDLGVDNTAILTYLINLSDF